MAVVPDRTAVSPSGSFATLLSAAALTSTPRKGYGDGDNEKPVSEALRPMREHLTISTKLRVRPATAESSIERQVREHLDASLRRLGTDHVELYYQHRQTPGVPVEGVAEIMSKLIDEGQILG